MRSRIRRVYRRHERFTWKERAKDRLRAFCEHEQLECPASPQRTEIDLFGGGGGYVQPGGLKRKASEIPIFPSENPLGVAEEIAQKSSWLSQPTRVGGESQTMPVKCDFCSALNKGEDLHCSWCHRELPPPPPKEDHPFLIEKKRRRMEQVKQEKLN